MYIRASTCAHARTHAHTRAHACAHTRKHVFLWICGLCGYGEENRPIFLHKSVILLPMRLAEIFTESKIPALGKLWLQPVIYQCITAVRCKQSQTVRYKNEGSQYKLHCLARALPYLCWRGSDGDRGHGFLTTHKKTRLAMLLTIDAQLINRKTPTPPPRCPGIEASLSGKFSQLKIAENIAFRARKNRSSTRRPTPTRQTCAHTLLNISSFHQNICTVYY